MRPSRSRLIKPRTARPEAVAAVGPPAFDPETYKDRHAVECGINALKHHHSYAVRYAATIHIAVIDHWLRRRT